MVQIWKLVVMRGDQHESRKEVLYFEDEEKMRAELFRAAVEVGARMLSDNPNFDREARMFLRKWRDKFRADEAQERFQAKKIISLEVLANSTWEPVDFRLIPPRLIVGEDAPD